MGKRQPESLGAALSSRVYAWERAHPSLPWGPLLSSEIRLVLTKPHPPATQPCTDLVPPLLAPLRPSCSLGLPHPARTCAVPSAWHAVPRGPTGSGVLLDGTSSETASQATPSTYTPLHYAALFLHSPYYCLTVNYTYLFTGGLSLQHASSMRRHCLFTVVSPRFWHFTSPQQTPTEKMNTVTKHPNVPTRQAYGQPTL